MNSFLGWLSAFFCVVCLIYLSCIITLPVTFIMAVSMMSTIGAVDWIDVNSPITFVIVGLASFTLFFPGMVIGRFLFRAIPPRLSGKRRKGVIGCFALLTILWVVTSFFNFQDFNSLGPVSLKAGNKESLMNAADAFQQRVFSPAAIQTLLFLMTVFWWLGFGVPLGVRHLNPRYFLKGPFVLLVIYNLLCSTRSEQRRSEGFVEKTEIRLTYKHLLTITFDENWSNTACRRL